MCRNQIHASPFTENMIVHGLNLPPQHNTTQVSARYYEEKESWLPWLTSLWNESTLIHGGSHRIVIALFTDDFVLDMKAYKEWQAFGYYF